MLSRLKNYWERFSGVEQKLLLVLFLLFVAGVTLAFWQSGRGKIIAPKNGGEYTEGLLGELRHINPLLASANAADMDVSRVIFNGLYKFDPNLNLVPDLAASLPEIGAGGKEYTIRLRDNVFWHDGSKFTADDVVFTLQAIQNPEYMSPQRFSWNRVGVQKIDEQTIKLTTREASSTFMENLTVGLLPQHIWGQVSPESFALSKYNLDPIGTGPFHMTELKRDRDGKIESIKLRAFDKFYAGRPYLDGLTFKFFETADALVAAYQGRNVMGLGYEPFDQSLFIKTGSGLQNFRLPLAQYQAVFINRAKNPAPLGDVRVRTALAKSVDKEKIITEIYGGQADDAYGPILPGYLGYHEQIPGADMNIYDPEKAKSLLTEAGWILDPQTGERKDKLGRVITLSLTTNNFPPNARTAEALKHMWEEIGIKITLHIETVADLESKFIRPREFELLLYSENIGADPDPYPFWHSSQLRDPGLNLSTFSNKQADKLLVEARGAIPAEERAKRYKQFQEIFVGDVPTVFLNRSVYVYNVASSVKGLSLRTIVTPSDRFTDIAGWYIETKRVKK